MKTHTQFLLFLSLFLFLNPLNINAQREAPSKWEARLGVGLLPTFIGNSVETDMIPLSFEIQYRPTAKYSIGLLAGHSASSATFQHHTGGEQMFSNRFTMAAVRGAVHNTSYEKWDFYAGMVLGYTHSDVTYEEDVSKNLDNTLPVPKVRNGFLFSGFVGTSFQAKERIHVFGELSYGLSILTAGVAFKL